MDRTTRYRQVRTLPPPRDGSRPRIPVVVCALLLLAPSAAADSTFATGGGALRAGAHVDFRIVIPQTLRVDLARPAPVGSNAIPGREPVERAGDGSLLTAEVFGNAGSVVVTGADHAFVDARDRYRAVVPIEAFAAPLGTPTVLAHPRLAAPGIGAVTLAARRSVVHQNARWSYVDSATTAAGTATDEARRIYTVQSP